MTVVIVVSAVVLTLASLLLVVRMTVGPTILDRSVALDVMLAVTMCAIALHAVATDSSAMLPILVVVSSVAFVGAVSIARYADRSQDVDAEASDREDT